jgi:hypothetical protein
MDSERATHTFMGLTLPQVAGGALAAVTAALAASRLGVTGTIVGAAFGSVTSTVAGAMYTQSLHRAQTRVTVTRQRLVRSTAQDRSDPSALPTDLDDEAQVVAESVSVTAPEGAEPDSLPGGLTAADRTSSTSPTTSPTTSSTTDERDRSRRPIKWALVVGAAAVIFVIAMVLISVLETAIGRPVSGGTSGTTISRIGSGGAAQPDPTPTVTDEPSVQPSATETPSESASPQGSPSEVVPVPSVDEASPTPGPADTSPAGEPAPTDAAPAPSPAAS